MENSILLRHSKIQNRFVVVLFRPSRTHASNEVREPSHRIQHLLINWSSFTEDTYQSTSRYVHANICLYAIAILYIISTQCISNTSLDFRQQYFLNSCTTRTRLQCGSSRWHDISLVMQCNEVEREMIS